MRCLQTSREQKKPRPRGYCGVAVYRPKHESNVGMLWRSAFLYGASSIGTIGRRYAQQACDTPNTPNHIPLTHYSDFNDFYEHLPDGCALIGVELAESAIPLNRFWHPPRALYLLGAEDRGLSGDVMDKCHQLVQIPALKEWSMNVAVAGSIVLNHRYMQGLA